jgi:hypothetical protein
MRLGGLEIKQGCSHTWTDGRDGTGRCLKCGKQLGADIKEAREDRARRYL